MALRLYGSRAAARADVDAVRELTRGGVPHAFEAIGLKQTA
jgi:hypothetical protein